MSRVVLHDYWRSSASYRVRIALNLLGIKYESKTVDLLAGEQRSPDHLETNPQGLVPVLEIDGQILIQSLSIIEYLHGTRAGSRLLPEKEIDAQKVRALSYAIAMEIHPVCNFRVAAFAAANFDEPAREKKDWMKHFISSGLADVEAVLQQLPPSTYCFGEVPTLADCCLVPQLYNARRWEVNLAPFPRLIAVSSGTEKLEAFRLAHPEVVKHSA